MRRARPAWPSLRAGLPAGPALRCRHRALAALEIALRLRQQALGSVLKDERVEEVVGDVLVVGVEARKRLELQPQRLVGAEWLFVEPQSVGAGAWCDREVSNDFAGRV